MEDTVQWYPPKHSAGVDSCLLGLSSGAAATFASVNYSVSDAVNVCSILFIPAVEKMSSNAGQSAKVQSKRYRKKVFIHKLKEINRFL